MNTHTNVNEAKVRAEIRAWMASNLCGEFSALRGKNSPGSAGYDAQLAKRWEQRLAQGGWVGLAWPHEFGGRAASLHEQVAFHEEYVSAGGPGRLGHIGETLLAPTLMAHGSAAQQQRFLPGIRNATEYWAQGYSEPGAGSDLANVQTRATLDAERGEWVIHGQKVWTSWARESDWIFVLVRTESGSRRHQGLSLLLVPLIQAGIRIQPITQMTGGAEFNEVFFDGARTEASLHLGPVGAGWKVAMGLLGFERGASTLGQQAHFRHELEQLISIAKDNGTARDPLIRQRIAEAALGLSGLRHHALRVLAANPAEALPPEAMISKYLWSNWHRDLGQLAVDVLGADANIDNGDPRRRSLQHLWLSSRAETIYAGSNEIQLNLIAERALGMPR